MLFVTILSLFGCPPVPELYIFKEKLLPGYEIGVDSSEGLTDWISDSGGSMKMEYPFNQSWGVVYITVTSPEHDPKPIKDLSAYTTLSVDLKGEVGGEKIKVGIKDKEDTDDGSETKIQVCDLTTDWQTIQIPLERFTTADLKNLYVVLEISLCGQEEQTVYFKNVKYMSGNHDEAGTCQDPEGVFTIYDGNLSEGYDMGVDSSRNVTNWLHDEICFMKVEYPSDQDWGAVFLTVGPPTDFPRLSQNFSLYTTLSVDLKGEKGGENLEIGIKDNQDPDNGSETKIKIGTLSTEWETYLFPLEEFTNADLENIYVVLEFVFAGPVGKTVYFDNIRYIE